MNKVVWMRVAPYVRPPGRPDDSDQTSDVLARAMSHGLSVTLWM